MKKIVLLNLIFILAISFVLADDGPSTLIGEYFLESGKSITVMGKTVGVGTVRSNGEVYVYIDSYGKYIYPSDGFIEYEGLIVEPLETFYDSTDPKGHSASIAVYSTIPNEIIGPNQDLNEYFFNVGIDAIDIDDKFVILERVGESGDVIVSVDGEQHTINSNSQKIIKCLIIKNKETFYDSKNLEGSSATLEIVVANLCDDIVINQENNECVDVKMVWFSGREDSYSYQDDLCSGYRCLNGREITPSCYNFEQCKESCGGDCVDIEEQKRICSGEVEITEKEAIKSDSGSWFFEVNSKLDLFGKTIKLLDVYEDGTAVIQVGEPIVIIFPQKSRQIYLSKGQVSGSFIEIKNEESFYSSKKEDRSVTLDISLGDYIAEKTPDLGQEFVDDNLDEQFIRCDGCLDAKDNCIPISVRIGDLYCDIDKEFKDQLKENALCNNNYECSSNLCIDNQCIESGLFKKILNWFRRVFG